MSTRYGGKIGTLALKMDMLPGEHQTDDDALHMVLFEQQSGIVIGRTVCMRWEGDTKRSHILHAGMLVIEPIGLRLDRVRVQLCGERDADAMLPVFEFVEMVKWAWTDFDKRPR